MIRSWVDLESIPAVQRNSAYRASLGLLYLVSLAGLAYLAWKGSSYYLTPLAERPRHEAYWALKPGGTLGNLYGVVGASLMVIMQLYTVRKRIPVLARLGSLRVWLDFHIFCGVIGPLFIVLHTSFKVHGLVALSFWSMVVVATSGILGRYLYLQLPRRRSGDELSLADLMRQTGELTDRLRREPDLDERHLKELDDLAAVGVRAEAPLLLILVRLPLDGWALRRRIRRFRRSLAGALSRAEVARVGRLALERAQLERRIEVLARLQEAFHYWHVLHKPFAVVMYVFMIVHIGVALMTGYAFGGR